LARVAGRRLAARLESDAGSRETGRSAGFNVAGRSVSEMVAGYRLEGNRDDERVSVKVTALTPSNWALLPSATPLPPESDRTLIPERLMFENRESANCEEEVKARVLGADPPVRVLEESRDAFESRNSERLEELPRSRTGEERSAEASRVSWDVSPAALTATLPLPVYT